MSISAFRKLLCLHHLIENIFEERNIINHWIILKRNIKLLLASSNWKEYHCLVAGAWGDSSKDLHALIQTCAESKVDHLCRSTGRPELESQLSVVVSQYRRLLSTTIVRAQAQCLISRIGVITPQARDAAKRREVAGRMERQMREERRANWMASLAGPGSARRGRCHTLIWFTSSWIFCRICPIDNYELHFSHSASPVVNLG